jgi:hypothetical protein
MITYSIQAFKDIVSQIYIVILQNENITIINDLRIKLGDNHIEIYRLVIHNSPYIFLSQQTCLL